MESDLGKLFIGGISWDTDEERLKEYFSKYGEVVEAVIMRDRATGRARGFGFIVFVDPSVAERVIMDKHLIDGRTVEAKKAVPRDDQHVLRRTASPVHSSPGPGGRTKKIFVGGLPSSITESEFKNYFDQFGMITDVVVMYDHNTQRPRGFGFITYDSEEAVDRVLHKTFHELNGKMVEVKRAVPKELAPGSNRSPFLGYNNYGSNRSTSFFNNFAPGYNIGSVGGIGLRVDGRFSPIGSGRTGFSPFGNAGYGLGVNPESGLTPSYNAASSFGNTLGYGRVPNSYYNLTSPNRYTTPIGYNSGRNDPTYNSTDREVWGNGGANFAGHGSFSSPVGSGLGISLGNHGANWTSPGFNTSAVDGYNGDDSTNYSLGGGGYGISNGTGVGGSKSSFSGSTGYEGSIGDLYRGGSVYGVSTWQSSSAIELDGSSHSFGYRLGNVGSEVAGDNSLEGYNGSYSVADRQSNRGIAA